MCKTQLIKHEMQKETQDNITSTTTELQTLLAGRIFNGTTIN